MGRENFLRDLEKKIRGFGRELSVLQDDMERGDSERQSYHEDVLRGLFRDYEYLESWLDKSEDIAQEDFPEQADLMGRRVIQFEEDLTDARKKIRDV